MTTPPHDAEGRVRAWLRDRVDGPPQPDPTPLVEVHVIPEPTAGDQDDEAPEQPEPTDPPWWHVIPSPWGSRTTPEPTLTPQQVIAAAPGIHVTVNQPAPEAAAPAEDEQARERRHRRQLLAARYGSAAAVGWWTGLCGQMSDMLRDAGDSAPAAGVAMALVTYVFASYLPGLPYMPPALRPATRWVACIPVSTTVLALCLNAPHALA
ncbi:hypothetical protein ACN6LM_003891 [Streptomyces sp. SAS_281]|uniref:hypothetical protein n=1 Tax=Streptomyces sp. SAS_281 TaxID=3412744 RepID=UPI00403C47DB